MAYKYQNVYEPEEDSKLLLKHTTSQLKHYLLGKNQSTSSLCEIGVGSGYVSSNLSKQFPNINYFGSDINPDAITLTQTEFEVANKKITLNNKPYFQGFQNKEKFDTIIFNTPYFPFESKHDNFENLTLKDRAIYGGPNGYETIQEFIEQTNDYLKNDGFVIMIFSSLSNLKHIEKILTRNLYEFEMLESENSFFEKIHCLKFKKSENLKKISNTNTKQIKYLAHGKHSTVLSGIYKSHNVIIKVGLLQHLDKEGFFEEKMKDESFIPKMYFRSPTFIIREKFVGQTIEEFINNKQTTLKELIIVLNEILKICQRIDELKITKFEMTNPYKHIYIEKDLKIGFIDFERCIFADKPKNTTQVLQYFRRNIPKFKEFGLNLNEPKIIELGKTYRETLEKFDITKILK